MTNIDLHPPAIAGFESAADGGLSIRQFGITYGPARTSTFGLIRSGALIAVKVGRRTFITRASAQAWFAGLPVVGQGRSTTDGGSK